MLAQKEAVGILLAQMSALNYWNLDEFLKTVGLWQYFVILGLIILKKFRIFEWNLFYTKKGINSFF
jgi:hypothetical protein